MVERSFGVYQKRGTNKMIFGKRVKAKFYVKQTKIMRGKENVGAYKRRIFNDRNDLCD